MTRVARPLALLVPLAGLAVAVVFATRPTAPPVAAQPAAPTAPADLALVPGDALGFAHVRVAEVWKSDALKPFRKVVEKAGPSAFESLDKDFTPAPSTLDRVTTVALPLDTPDMGNLRTVTILAFTKPFDAAAVTKQYMPKGEEKKANGKAYTTDKLAGVAIHFADDKTLVFGDADSLPAFLNLKGKPSGALAGAIQQAANKPLLACVNVKALPIPEQLKNDIPDNLKPLLAAETLVLSAELGKEMNLTLAVGFASADDAKGGEKALRAAADMARQMLVGPRAEAERLIKGDPVRKKDSPRPLEDLIQAAAGLGLLGGVNSLDEILADPPLTVDGNTVTAVIPLPAEVAPLLGPAVVAAGVGLPAFQKARNAAARTQSMNNLKQIGLAMHNYESTHGTFPPAAICDKKGKKLLSWRVAILPYIEQDNVYKLFKLDEPWDSEHNKPLGQIAIKTYVDPRADLDGKLNHTHYKVFTGNGAAFDTLLGRKFAQITDGLSNTVMVVAAGEAVPWSKPDDFEFDPKKDLPDLSKPFGDLLMLFCDGSVRAIRPDQRKDFDSLMKLLIQMDDGMVIGDF
jgi:type II secretory pathway pseudopilin PulG